MVRPQNTTALEGNRVKLSCQAEAFPNNVTYEWLHEGNAVPPTSRTTIYADGSLVFASVDVGDAGWYTCRPTNGLGLTPEARAYLNVTCKSPPTRNTSKSSKPCGILFSGPPIRYRVTWFRTSDLQPRGSIPGRVNTLGKLFTLVHLCHRAVRFGTGQRAALVSINEVNPHRARLMPGWVTVSGFPVPDIYYLGM